MANECNWKFRLYKPSTAVGDKLNDMYQMALARSKETKLGRVRLVDFHQTLGILAVPGQGPKWNFVEEYDQQEHLVMGSSAWSVPENLFLGLVKELAKLDETVMAIATFADESLEFVGSVGFLGTEECISVRYSEREILTYTRRKIFESTGIKPHRDTVDDSKWEYAWMLVDSFEIESKLNQLFAKQERAATF